MFCQNCGKRVKESWAVCPNCGCKILERDDVVSEERDYHLFGMRRTGRFTFWKIPTIIKVKGDSIHVITHGKKIRKKRFRKQEIEEIDFPILPVWRISDIFRIVIFGIMLLLTMGLSIFAVLFSIKIAVSRHLRIKLASGQIVKIPICQKADASDFLNELDYSTEEIERNNAKKISNKKWMRRERIIYIVLFVIAVITMCLGFQLQMGDIQNEEKPKVKKEIEVKEKNNIDYSGTDMEDFIGQPEKILEGTDFTYNEGDSGYQLLDRDVIVECVDGKVHMIMIADAGELAPSFHGVRVGMSVDEADQLLIDRYKSAGETDDKRAYIDLESGISVELRVNNNSIEEINITQLTEDEIQGYLQENYIFPDSDKKYLSEDEVRNATTEELFIGRNEIFARHGYIFEDEGLRQHFMNTPWYQEVVPGDQFNVDTELNDFEKKNVELIKKIEDEINGAVQMNAEQQQAINDAYNFLLGHSFHLQDSQPLMEFQSSDTIIYYWGGEIPEDYYNYSITARYEVYKDDLKDWLLFITIDGEEYYLRYFTNGLIDLTSMSGNGLLDGWYEMYS